jgi:oxalate decarboxylase/phosphoglucose isomerase-like protein (cupin superfamily)
MAGRQAGDIVFVPRNWFHAVVNLEDETVAVAGGRALGV